jgi:hypothetical protein
LALAEDREATRSCIENLTFRSQRQRLSFLRRGVRPRPAGLESTYFQKLMRTRQAVPTGEAHRLPKSARYVSALPSQVKPIWA